MLPTSKTGRDMEDLIALKIELEELFSVLTDKQCKVLSFLYRGYNLTETGKLLGISDNAVAAHRKCLAKKAARVLAKHDIPFTV